MPSVSHIGAIVDGQEQYQPAMDVMQAALGALGMRGAIIGPDADFTIPSTATYVVVSGLSASRAWALPDVDGYPYGQDLVIVDEYRSLGAGPFLTITALAGSSDAIAGYPSGIQLSDAGAGVRLRRSPISDIWVVVGALSYDMGTLSQPLRVVRDPDAAVSAYVGPSGEPVFNVDTNTLHMQDGSTPGGHAVMNRDFTAPNSAVPSNVYLNLIEKIRFSQYCPGDANRDSGADIDKMLDRANSAPRGAQIVVPDYIYYTSRTHTITGRVHIEGPGGSTGRIIQTTSNKDLFMVATDTAVSFSGLCLQQQNSNQTSGRLITVGGSATQNRDTSIDDCVFLNGWMQLDTQNASKLHVNNSRFVSYVIGARIQNTYDGDQGDFAFDGCNFGTEAGLGKSAILLHSAGGLRVCNSKLIGGDVGLKMQLKDIANIPSNATTILIVDGSSIEGQTLANIELTHDPSTTNAHFSMVDINAGELAIFGAGGRNVWVHGDYVFLDSLNIRPGAMQCPPGAVGLDIDVVKSVHVAPGVVTGGYTGSGVNQPIGTIEVVRGNVLYNTRTPYSTTTDACEARIINQSMYAHADDEIRVYHPGATTTNTLDAICYTALIDNDNSSCRVEIETDGYIPGVGPVYAKSSFLVTRGVGAGSIAVSAPSGTQSVGGISHVSSLESANGRVIFYASFSASGTNNNLSHRVKVIGRYCRIQKA